MVQRGTAKKLRKLKLNLAGKTGTTNENTDAWFIGFTSNLVIGVYLGMDNPKSLGKYETGSKTALPVFENFIKKAVKKSDARPFKVSDGITMMVVDSLTGQKAKFSSKNTILEAYKSKNVVDGKILYSNKNRLDSNNILKVLLMDHKYLDYKKEIEKINQSVNGNTNTVYINPLNSLKFVLNKLKKDKKNLNKDFWIFTGSTAGVVPIKSKGLYLGKIAKLGSSKVKII